LAYFFIVVGFFSMLMMRLRRLPVTAEAPPRLCASAANHLRRQTIVSKAPPRQYFRRARLSLRAKPCITTLTLAAKQREAVGGLRLWREQAPPGSTDYLVRPILRRST
jgi:hypothetical protein